MVWHFTSYPLLVNAGVTWVTHSNYLRFLNDLTDKKGSPFNNDRPDPYHLHPVSFKNVTLPHDRCLPNLVI